MFKQHKTRSQVLDAYRKVKQALKNMGDEYVTSKETKNIFVRYGHLRRMVKNVVILERQYWSLIDVPKQELKESEADYVTRFNGNLLIYAYPLKIDVLFGAEG